MYCANLEFGYSTLVTGSRGAGVPQNRNTSSSASLTENGHVRPPMDDSAEPGKAFLRPRASCDPSLANRSLPTRAAAGAGGSLHKCEPLLRLWGTPGQRRKWSRYGIQRVRCALIVQSSFLVKRNKAVLSSEPGNLRAKHSFKYADRPARTTTP